MDVRPVVAEARALADYSLMYNPFESSEDIQRRFVVLGWVTKIIGQVVDLERKIAPLSLADLDRLTNAFASALQVLPPEDARAVLDQWRLVLIGGQRSPQGKKIATEPAASIRSSR